MYVFYTMIYSPSLILMSRAANTTTLALILLFDTLAVVFTAKKTFGNIALQRETKLNYALSYFLLRDGENLNIHRRQSLGISPVRRLHTGKIDSTPHDC